MFGILYHGLLMVSQTRIGRNSYARSSLVQPRLSELGTVFASERSRDHGRNIRVGNHKSDAAATMDAEAMRKT